MQEMSIMNHLCPFSPKKVLNLSLAISLCTAFTVCLSSLVLNKMACVCKNKVLYQTISLQKKGVNTYV